MNRLMPLTNGCHSARAPAWRHLLALACLAWLGLGLAAAAHTDGDDTAEMETLADEMEALGPWQATGLRVGNQAVFRARTRGERFSGSDPLLDALRRIAPRIEAELRSHGARPDRAVLLAQSTGATFAESMAFTQCAEAALPHWVAQMLGGTVPSGACLIVVYPDRIAGADLLEFVLAHEWMHTAQYAAYGQAVHGGDWWREGSADWFGHRIVPAMTARDDVIASFFERQQTGPLNTMDYAAQVFFFWAERTLYATWVFELGIGGQDWLARTDRVAQLLPPERWLDWAKAQADETIMLPDGRPLPAAAPAPPLLLGADCATAIEGPPLSVQLRQVILSGAPLRAEANGARLSFRPAATGRWHDLPPDGLWEEPPPGPAMVAAIQPADAPLLVRLTQGPEARGGAAAPCGCLVGTWQELPREDDSFIFRSDAPEYARQRAQGSGEAQIATHYAHPGPVLSLLPDGSYLLDDPAVQDMIHPFSHEPILHEGAPVWQMQEDVFQDFGIWREVDGHLHLRKAGTLVQGWLRVLGDVHRINETRDRPARADRPFEAACEAGELRLYSPGAAQIRATGAAVVPVARLRRIAP